MPDEKTLCNLSNCMSALCDGAEWDFDEQAKYCDGATEAHSRSNRCIHLCDNERCDSHTAQDIAVKSKG